VRRLRPHVRLRGWLVLLCAGLNEGCPRGAGLSSAQEDEPWSSIQRFSWDWM
jgi:hypothetical protein